MNATFVRRDNNAGTRPVSAEEITEPLRVRRNRSSIELPMMVSKKLYLGSLVVLVAFVSTLTTSCGAYSFSGASVPDSIKTVKVNFIENKARYNNPQLSPRLTDRLRQKITNQTKLTPTNNEEAHYMIDGFISDYSVTTSGISNQQTVNNRLTVGVHITLNNHLAGEKKEYDVSRSFEFSANSSLQTAEAALMDEIIRGLTDDIFNRIFSNW